MVQTTTFHRYSQTWPVHSQGGDLVPQHECLFLRLHWCAIISLLPGEKKFKVYLMVFVAIMPTSVVTQEKKSKIGKAVK